MLCGQSSEGQSTLSNTDEAEQRDPQRAAVPGDQMARITLTVTVWEVLSQQQNWRCWEGDGHGRWAGRAAVQKVCAHQSASLPPSDPCVSAASAAQPWSSVASGESLNVPEPQGFSL